MPRETDLTRLARSCSRVTVIQLLRRLVIRRWQVLGGPTFPLTVDYGKGAQRGAHAGPRGTWSPSTMSLCWGLSGKPAAGYQ
jgi:hypothetical protein